MKLPVYIFFIIFTFLFPFSVSFAEDDSAAHAKSIKKGKKAYRRYCSACHGKTGIGNGPGAQISGIPPSDLTNKAYMSLFSDEELMERLKYGEDGFPYIQMSGIARKASTQTIWNIVDYVRTLAVDKGPLKGYTPKEREERFKDPLNRGLVYYLRYCSPCHGKEGDGKGWAARTLEGTPVAHNDPAIMSKFTRQDIYKHVKGMRKKKDRTMPVFAKAITPPIVKAIAAYTKTLSENKK